MKYKNTKTGFVFDTPCELKGADWELISSAPIKSEEKEKPVKPKRNKKDE